MQKTVGILALQGAYQKHADILSLLGVQSMLVRRPEHLHDCAALILPGGESTSISLLIQKYELAPAIKKLAETRPVMGVCAGMVLMASEVNDTHVQPLALAPMRVQRNHYGRQLHSFTAELELAFDATPYRAHFIRAPAVESIGNDTKILACVKNQPVMVQYGQHLALSFHPELTHDTRIHQYWLKHVKQQ